MNEFNLKLSYDIEAMFLLLIANLRLKTINEPLAFFIYLVSCLIYQFIVDEITSVESNFVEIEIRRWLNEFHTLLWMK